MQKLVKGFLKIDRKMFAKNSKVRARLICGRKAGNRSIKVAA